MKRNLLKTLCLGIAIVVFSCNDKNFENDLVMLKKGKPVRDITTPCLIQINLESNLIEDIISGWPTGNPDENDRIALEAGKAVLEYYGISTEGVSTAFGNNILCIVADLSTYGHRIYFEHGDKTDALINDENPEAKNDHILWAEQIFEEQNMLIKAWGKPEKPPGKNKNNPPEPIVETLSESAKMILDVNDEIGLSLLPQISKRVWILDTGIEPHEDLNVGTGLSFVDYTSSTHDDNGHGTHVAGIVGAYVNEQGVVGIAPGIELIPLKILDQEGTCTRLELMEAINYLGSGVLEPNDVVLISCGEYNTCNNIKNALENLAEKESNNNIKFAIAGGNMHFPATMSAPVEANHRNIYGVSACDVNGNFAEFSSHGNGPIDICAPGVGILSTYGTEQYETMSGTSMAAAHIAGLLALGWDGQFEFLVCEDTDYLYDYSDGEHRISYFKSDGEPSTKGTHWNGFKDPIAKFNGPNYLYDDVSGASSGNNYLKWFSLNSLPYGDEGDQLYDYSTQGMPDISMFPTFPGGTPY